MKSWVCSALLLLVGALALPAQTPDDPLGPAIEAIAQGDLRTAEEGFREALRQDPTNERAWLGLSAFQAARGEIVDALKSARRADALLPDQPITLLTISRLQATLGSWNSALQTLDRARALDDRNGDDDVWLLSALLLRDMDRPGEAIELLEQALGLGLDDPRLAEELGLLLLSQNRPAEALQRVQKLLAEAPERGRPHLIAGLSLAADQRQRQAAIDHLEIALASQVDALDSIHLGLANLLMAEGRPAEALEHLAAVEATRPGDPEVHYRKGLALQAVGDAEGAQAALDTFQALKQSQLNAEAGALRLQEEFDEAKALAAEDKLPEALENIDAILRERPQHARTLALRGKVLFAMGRGEEALASMTEARILDPGTIEHLYLEGIFLQSLDRAAEAETALLRAVAIHGSRPEMFELLSQAAAGQNKYEKAVVYIELALELGRDSAGLRLHYANLLDTLGRTEDFEREMATYRRLRDAGVSN